MDTTGTSGSLLSPPWTLVGHAGALDAGLATREPRVRWKPGGGVTGVHC